MVTYTPGVAIFQELSGQGRVVGGHLASGTVLSGGTGPLSRNSDLSIQHPSNPFKRHRINAETVTAWEELDVRKGLAGTVGRAAASAAIPGRVGKAVGAGLGAAVNSGHTVRVSWTDAKQSIIELPEKQFIVFSVLLKDLQVMASPEAGRTPDPLETQPRLSDRVVDLAQSVVARNRSHPVGEAGASAANDVTDQIAKLAALHAQGILTDEEFADKKAELLKRL